MKPTDEQDNIVAAAKRGENLMIQAYAGTGKTTTIEMVARECKQPDALAVAFNVKIKKELEKRLPKNFTTLTLNGAGHRAWSRALTGKRLTLDERKLGRIINDLTKQYNMELSQEEWGELRRAVSKAKSIGLARADAPKRPPIIDTEENWVDLFDMVLEPGDNLIALASKVLQQSVREAMAGIIDFDDQIYMPTLFGGRFTKHSFVAVDEAQDLSVLNHIMLRRMATRQVCVFGDRYQSIYAFRGADHESMDNIRKLKETWTDLNLSVTFRCPQLVVERQLSHAAGYKAAASNPQGSVSRLYSGWDITNLPSIGPIAFLCRNNAPLIGIAFKLLSRGIGVNMLGRDIGKGLINLVQKLAKPADRILTVLSKLDEWGSLQKANAIAKKQEQKIASINDKIEGIYAIAENEEIITCQHLLDAIRTIFESYGAITLSTGHRAKGLEWDTVIHLDPWRIPSRYAKEAAENGQPAQLIQEENVRYVIETRTKQNLILANKEDYGETKVKIDD